MLVFFRLMIIGLLLPANMAAAQLTASPQIPSSLSKDQDLLQRYWDWLKIETGAPEDMPWPSIVVEALPSNIRMFLSYPTRQYPAEKYKISISRRAIIRAENNQGLWVLSELAHELVHHALLQKEHNWVFTRRVYNNAIHGHCDQEFQRLANHIGEVVWQAYHSNNLVRDIEQLTRNACWESGHILSDRD